MSLADSFATSRVITVSGLHSGIGKTLLAEHLISLLPGCAAIKITISDNITRVTVDKALIMVEGKDTHRLKKSGAGAVVWVQSRPDDLESSVRHAAGYVTDYEVVIIEGNSILDLLTPDLSFFVCDGRLASDASVKPNRLKALARADVIINNLRGGQSDDSAALEAACRKFNQHASLYAINLEDQKAAVAVLRTVLKKARLCTAT